MVLTLPSTYYAGKKSTRYKEVDTVLTSLQIKVKVRK